MKRHARKALIIILALGAVIVLALGCAKKTSGKKSPQPATSTAAPPETKEWKPVKSADSNFSLKVPQAWEVKKAGELNLGKGKLFVVFGPEAGNYRTNLQASVEKIPDISLSDYISQFEKNTRSNPGTEELRVLEGRKVASDLGEVYLKKYSYILSVKGHRFNLIFEVLYIKRGNKYFVTQIVTTDKLFKDVKKTFDNILATIEIK